jgi:hypothetical protein
VLRELGLFIGNDLEDNSESMFFINHNDWLFASVVGHGITLVRFNGFIKAQKS